MTKIILAAALVLAIVYAAILRPWIMRMGASRRELNSLMPGDGLVQVPNMKYTQGLTIKAPRRIVWAYLVQMGYKRAGWYNWDFINRMADRNYFYEGLHSADRIIPELQDLRRGDKIYLTPQLGMEVEQIVPGEYLVLTGREGERHVVVWTFQVGEPDEQTSRLVVRWTSNQNETRVLRVLNYLLIEPGGAGVQQALNLRGIRKRAEREWRQNRTPVYKV